MPHPCLPLLQEPTYVSGESVDEPEEETISLSEEDAKVCYEEYLTPRERGARLTCTPPAIFISTPAETEIVMAMDSSRYRTGRRASEVYNVAFDDEMPEDTSFEGYMVRYREQMSAEEIEDSGWTTVEEVALKIERDIADEIYLEEVKKSCVKQKMSPRKAAVPASPKRTPKKSLAKAAIESPFKKSPKNSPKNSPRNSPLVTKKLLPEIVESSVQQYRPVYQTELGNTNLVPKPYSPNYSVNTTTIRSVKVPVACPRTFFHGPEITSREEETSMAKESKDTRGKVKKTQKNVREPQEDGVRDEIKSPSSSSMRNLGDSVNPEEIDVSKSGDQENKPKLSSEKERPASTPNSPTGSNTNQENTKLTSPDDMIVTRVTTFTTSDVTNSSQEPQVQPKQLSFDLDPDERVALSSLEAAVMDDTKPSPLRYSCSNRPFNSFDELEAMTDEPPDQLDDAKTNNTKGSKSSSVSEIIKDQDEVDCADALTALDDTLEDGLNDDFLPAYMESDGGHMADSAVSVNTLSRDSLGGFLNDDIHSLRSFVAQKNLDEESPPRELKKKEESVEFMFEEVDDHPIKVAPEKVVEEKKRSKMSPNFGKFTQKVSDKNNENEEKTKASLFNPRNILSFGTKDKNKTKPKTAETDTPKNEGWSSEAIEDYLLKNTQEESVRLGLLNEEDVMIHRAKSDGNLKVPDRRKIPEVRVSDELIPTTPGSASRKRQAPNPPGRKSPSWRPQDIENYLLEHNMNENLRLGLLSQEDIEIYEWKRATVTCNLTSWYLVDGFLVELGQVTPQR
ncbi:ataxin-2 homolog [Homarus americanus]|uniref:ataxin-2 homolog n=1 Tax=Homarus americanus TaxID=6706 RepID=UPI001C484666|nr:ataxin-2 homolog [Homarus americanus]